MRHSGSFSVDIERSSLCSRTFQILTPLCVAAVAAKAPSKETATLSVGSNLPLKSIIELSEVSMWLRFPLSKPARSVESGRNSRKSALRPSILTSPEIDRSGTEKIVIVPPQTAASFFPSREKAGLTPPSRVHFLLLTSSLLNETRSISLSPHTTAWSSSGEMSTERISSLSSISFSPPLSLS